MMQDSNVVSQPSHYVAIGASAGGLEALELFFKNMDARSNAAFIVIQHLSPDHKSLMVELLSKRTHMQVQRAEEGMLVEANNVYLIPPNNNLRIFHGKLMLTEQVRHGEINLPIDILFNSLAEDQGEKAIGVILSGTGSDGTQGVKTIKEFVGMVMVQSEESAQFDGMPRSAAATGLIDYILPPEEMPEQLLSYIKHPYANKGELSDTLLNDEDGLARIFLMLREKTGIDFTHYKPSTVVRRIERRMTVNQILELRDYVRYMVSYPNELTLLLNDLLIGVTRFFRDQAPFDELKENCLPDLMRRKSESNEQLRIWVAGCSSGEEAYSMAIICQEIMTQLGILVDVKIFATDVDKRAITAAGAGIFADSIAADVSPALLTKYFFRRDDGFLVSRHIREMVVFAQHNLVKDPPFTNMDLISCRNLLIYLQSVLQKRAMELFNFALNSQGILLLGSSETTGDMADYFDTLNHKLKIYQSKGRKPRTALSDPANNFIGSPRRTSGNNKLGNINGAGVIRQEERLQERLLQGISGSYLPFCMVIDEDMELLHVVGDSREYLKVPTGIRVNTVNKLAHMDLAIPISTGIQRVIKENCEVTYTNIHLRTPDKETKVVEMRISPLPTRQGQEHLFAIFIIENHSISHDEGGKLPTETYDLTLESEHRIDDLEQELQFTRENLQATVEELETSNEELQATNEELLASNEELQSTNEELQSVNEELYTVNAEYQSKITELTELNNDLDNLLTSTQIATLFLDDNLDIRRFTPEIGNLIRIIDQDIGRPFVHLVHDLVDVSLDEIVRLVRHDNRLLEREVQTHDGKSYLMRVMPYQIAPNTYAGIVITFVNIDKTWQMRMALEKSEARYALAQKAGKIGSWEWDLESGTIDWSETIEPMFGFGKGEFGGTIETFSNTIHPEDRSEVKEASDSALKNIEQNYSVEHRIIWPDGTVRCISAMGEVIRDEDQEPVRMLGVMQDITERKLIQKNLEQSEFLFRTTLENLDMTVVQLDCDANVVFANKFFIDFCGWSRDELIGLNWVETFIPEDQKNEVKGVFDSFIQGKTELYLHYENEIIAKNGKNFVSGGIIPHCWMSKESRLALVPLVKIWITVWVGCSAELFDI